MAYSFLGNLLYDRQPGPAITAWERSSALNSTMAVVYRNLGFAYGRDEEKVNEAIIQYERALELNPKDPRILYEQDLIYELAGTALGKRLAVLESNLNTVLLYDNAISRLINLFAITGRHGEAIDLLLTHHFHSWEGGGQIRNVYADVHLLRGLERYDAGQYLPALSDIQAALEYPENLEVGRPLYDRRAIKASVIQGRIHEALGNFEKADTAFREAAQPAFDPGNSDALYYQGYALQRLGDGAQAKDIFEELVRVNRMRLDAGTRRDFFAKFGERQAHKKRMAEAYYLMGLGYAGLGKERRAISAFKNALALNGGHLWAAWYMKHLER
jgi:tetratricopeptide (TPR) repeat protein